MYEAGPAAQLVEKLARLPGIGPKTAQRLAFYLLSAPPEVARELARAIEQARASITRCSQCANLTDTDPCAICSDPRRQRQLLCVVEQPRDVLALEKARAYKGLYHVLHGALSPARGIGPGHLTLDLLRRRLESGEIKEVILATNPNVEGDATAMYLMQWLRPLGVTVTRLAYGLPVGASLEYADELTLTRALENRR
ncbi:MAG: recombination mediator RecR [Desulfurispora sp.]|uniref:recombination mediator RecR n=1 Tax=Desulfurispora sp. TaxID=3014275 RepID=UPI0040492A75